MTSQRCEKKAKIPRKSLLIQLTSLVLHSVQMCRAVVRPFYGAQRRKQNAKAAWPPRSPRPPGEAGKGNHCWLIAKRGWGRAEVVRVRGLVCHLVSPPPPLQMFAIYSQYSLQGSSSDPYDSVMSSSCHLGMSRGIQCSHNQGNPGWLKPRPHSPGQSSPGVQLCPVTTDAWLVCRQSSWGLACAFLGDGCVCEEGFYRMPSLLWGRTPFHRVQARIRREVIWPFSLWIYFLAFLRGQVVRWTYSLWKFWKYVVGDIHSCFPPFWFTDCS